MATIRLPAIRQPMTRQMRAWRLAVLMSLAIGFALAPARAAFEAKDEDWEGTRQLLQLAREQLGEQRVVLAGTLDWSELGPEDGLLVLHPEVSLDYEETSEFLRAGGRLAMLDDYGRGDELLERFSIRRVQAPMRPGRMLRDNPNLAIASPATQLVAGHEQGRHPIVASAQRVVTNHPTALTHPDLTPVLEIPAVGEPNATLAVTGIIVERGRLFAMGDPSVVINLMMRYPGNRAFASGLIQYLLEEDHWGSRGGTLYLATNRFHQRGQYGGQTGLGREIREHLESLQQLVHDTREGGLPELVALVLAALATLVAALWMGFLATRPYRRAAPRYATGPALVTLGGLAGRAAVLAAPTTHRSLPMLELKSALVEGLAHRLGLDRTSSPTTLMAQIEQRDALSPRHREELKEMFAELKRIEVAVAASQAPRIPEAAVERMRARIMAVLAELDERTGSNQ